MGLPQDRMAFVSVPIESIMHPCFVNNGIAFWEALFRISLMQSHAQVVISLGLAATSRKEFEHFCVRPVPDLLGREKANVMDWIVFPAQRYKDGHDGVYEESEYSEYP